VGILLNRNDRVIIQGITGRQGSFHAQRMLDYGTQVVGGVSPGKGGEWFGSIPVFDTMERAVEITEANVSVILVPADRAPDAIFEAVDAGIRVIVCISDNIPTREMTKVYHYLQGRKTRLIGPNCPGILIPDQISVGIIPAVVALPGSVGVVSRSGTLTYEVCYVLKSRSIGQSTIVGLGSDPIIGTRFDAVLDLFESDQDTSHIVLLSESGGLDEVDAANFIQSRITKPVVAYIAGRNAAPGKRMGYRGITIDDISETAPAKIALLEAAGARVATTLDDIPTLLTT
jgi:succinyl-CoA synthetase alpha subunit